MREALGMPQKVIAVSLTRPIWSATFKYSGFVVHYESGIDNIPRFAASLEIFSDAKSVTAYWDSAYIKGLPQTMTVRENVSGKFVETGED
jgi:hypothetical protein